MSGIFVDYAVAVVVQTVEIFVGAGIDFRIVVVAVARPVCPEKTGRLA